MDKPLWYSLATVKLLAKIYMNHQNRGTMEGEHKEYNKTRSFFSDYMNLYGFVISAIMIYLAVPPKIYHGLEGILGKYLGFMGFNLVMDLIFLPLNIVDTFVIEERFGFNRYSLTEWVKEWGIRTLVHLVLFLPAYYLIANMTDTDYWWLYAAIIMVLIEVVLTIAHPYLDLYLHYNVTELEEGTIKERLREELGPDQKILVIDQSKKSGHANAYFSGLGKHNHLVLYDNLLKVQDEDQVISTVMHELGHRDNGHIWINMVIDLVKFTIRFFVVDQIMKNGWFNNFGFDPRTPFFSAYIVYSLFRNQVAFWFKPLENWISQWMEYQADNHVKDKEGLINGLKNIAKNNKSQTQFDPIWKAFHRSHPTVEERMKNLL